MARALVIMVGLYSGGLIFGGFLNIQVFTAFMHIGIRNPQIAFHSTHIAIIGTQSPNCLTQ